MILRTRNLQGPKSLVWNVDIPPPPAPLTLKESTKGPVNSKKKTNDQISCMYLVYYCKIRVMVFLAITIIAN